MAKDTLFPEENFRKKLFRRMELHLKRLKKIGDEILEAKRVETNKTARKELNKLYLKVRAQYAYGFEELRDLRSKRSLPLRSVS
jgi:hypothetical protein